MTRDELKAEIIAKVREWADHVAKHDAAKAAALRGIAERMAAAD
jgi:hypothetical protein